MKEQEILKWINKQSDKEETLVWFNRRRTNALFLSRRFIGGKRKNCSYEIGTLDFIELRESKKKASFSKRSVSFLKDIWMLTTDREHYREFIGQFMEDEDNEPEIWPIEKIDTLFEFFKLSDTAKKNLDNPFYDGPVVTVTDWRGTIDNALYINMGVPLRTGGRKTVSLTKEEFEAALLKKKENHKKALKELYGSDDESNKFSWIFNLGLELDWKWVKDVSKVRFDFENWEVIQEVKTTPKKGIPYLECFAGGDWQYPVYFFLYWDGKDIRGYVPTKGNTFNAALACAFGEEMEFLPLDEEEKMTDSDWKKNSGYYVAQQCFPEILDGKSPKEVDILSGEYGLLERVRINMDACLEDFEERLEVV